MKKINIFSLLVMALLFSGIAYGQKPVDRLGVTGPVNFGSKAYYLDWASHPSATYYKQEYLCKGDTTGHYSRMLMLEAVTGNVDIKKVVAAKIAELDNLKKSNPAVQYESFQNASTGEYMIDFLLMQNAADGKSEDIAEHNIYRYKTFTSNGKKGLMLFGVSTRSYGNDISAFLVALKTTKRKTADDVLTLKLPVLSVR